MQENDHVIMAYRHMLKLDFYQITLSIIEYLYTRECLVNVCELHGS